MPKQQSHRLLVVDDDPGVLASYRLVLEDPPVRRASADFAAIEREILGAVPDTSSHPAWRVSYADQGEQAIEYMKQAIALRSPYTAVFLDIRMPPGMDGYDTALEIRKLDPHVHIVIVSGYHDFTEEDLLEVAGPKGSLSMLPKPVWPADLYRVASELCMQREPA